MDYNQDNPLAIRMSSTEYNKTTSSSSWGYLDFDIHAPARMR